MRAVQYDDEGLWAAALTGDGQAFGLLFDRHHEVVRRHASRIVQNPTDADDVAAVAFLELWRRRSSVHLTDGSVRPWLFVTATYAARNLSRSRRRYDAFLARLPPAPSQPDAAELAFADDPAAGDPQLASALRRLSLRDQQLVGLVILQDVPVTHAAQVLGLSVPAAKSRLLRARRQLAQRLRDPSPLAGGARTLTPNEVQP